MAVVNVAPLTRIEGHLDVLTDVGPSGGVNRILNAKTAGTTFRGFEKIMIGRDPRDAVHLTQRICGVCPISHGVVSSMTLESAFGIPPLDNGRIMRNLVLGSNYLQSHILHFYHLSIIDYVDPAGTAIAAAAPWKARFTAPDMIGGNDAANLVSHYLQAFEYRRKAHQMAAIFGGKLPHSPALVPGGCTETPTVENIAAMRTLLKDIRWFVENVYVPDALLLARRFPEYYKIGRGYGNLLSFGAFDQNAKGTKKLFRRGRYTVTKAEEHPGKRRDSDILARSFGQTEHAMSARSDSDDRRDSDDDDRRPSRREEGRFDTVDPTRIVEYLKYSRFAAASGNKNPALGDTTPDPTKPGAYSFAKAPRYLGKPHEAGPLARMWINGDYRRGISVMDRIVARALESRKLAYVMSDWLKQLVPGISGKADFAVPTGAVSGIGLTEAPRGAIGHWMQTDNQQVTRYQVITPTAWNCSPMDDMNQKGPIERALLGTAIANTQQPIEVLRVVHSFDPCMACSVH